MKKPSNILGAGILVATLTMMFDVHAANAVPIPDPQRVALGSQQTAFLLAELKYARDLRERTLIHDELVLVSLDRLRDPG